MISGWFKMMYFHERFELAELFATWATENNAASVPMNMVVWLEINNLIDEDKMKEFLKEHKSNGK